MAGQGTSDLGADQPCEAGIFSLTPDGWVLLQRREYPNMLSASRWMRSRTDMLTARRPQLRFRASAVTLGGWLTLDTVLADIEAKRKAGDPEFSDTSLTTGKGDDFVDAKIESKER